VSRQEWNEWAAQLAWGGNGEPDWRARHLKHLLDRSPSLKAASPESIPTSGRRILAWLVGWDEPTLEGLAQIIEAVAVRPAADLDADELQGLAVSLHAAHFFMTRWAAGDVDLNDPTDAVAAGALLETLEHWRNEVERRRPKTTVADLR
jgi:hypothetical protein